MVSSMHALALLSAASAALAVRVPYTGVRTADAADYFPHLAESLVRRASAVVDGAVTLNDSKDMSYYIDLYVFVYFPVSRCLIAPTVRLADGSSQCRSTPAGVYLDL
jgi:hypothetical protein